MRAESKRYGKRHFIETIIDVCILKEATVRRAPENKSKEVVSSAVAWDGTCS